MAEGYTFLQHFGRTYPSLFQDKCAHCNGAGIVTCPHCNGYKVKLVRPKTFRLSAMTSLANVHSIPVQHDCEHCGSYCEWDKEKEWEGRWAARQSSFKRSSRGKVLLGCAVKQWAVQSTPSNHSVSRMQVAQVGEDARVLRPQLRQAAGRVVSGAAPLLCCCRPACSRCLQHVGSHPGPDLRRGCSSGLAGGEAPLQQRLASFFGAAPGLA
jgi:hypothetical protein